MQRVVDVEDHRVGAALGSAPEGLARGCCLIAREVEQKLLDLIREVVLEMEASPLDAVVERDGTVIDQCALKVKSR